MDYDYKYLSKKYLFKKWNKNQLCPMSQTVLNTASSLAITMKYKKIVLVGADTSWVELYRVDQKTNDLYIDDKHYYDNERHIVAKYDPTKSNMAEELNTIEVALEYYQLLKEYAIYNGGRLYNASEYSLIDCIPRVKLKRI